MNILKNYDKSLSRKAQKLLSGLSCCLQGMVLTFLAGEANDSIQEPFFARSNNTSQTVITDEGKALGVLVSIKLLYF